MKEESASESALLGLMEACLMSRQLERDHERRSATSRAEWLARISSVLREAYEASAGCPMFPPEPTEAEWEVLEKEWAAEEVPSSSATLGEVK